jgi:hypothetical protein
VAKPIDAAQLVVYNRSTWILLSLSQVPAPIVMCYVALYVHSDMEVLYGVMGAC